MTECGSANPLTVAIEELVEGKVLVRVPGGKDEPSEAETEPAAEESEEPASE